MLQYLGHLICYHFCVHRAQAEYTNIIKASLARYRPLPMDSWERSYALTSSGSGPFRLACCVWFMTASPRQLESCPRSPTQT